MANKNEPPRAGERRTRSSRSLPGGSARVVPDETALYCARRLSKSLRAPIFENRFATELIDVTRSLHHRQLFSATTRSWSDEERQQLVELIYEPYRRGLLGTLRTMLSRSSYVIHLSFQSVPLRSASRGGGSSRQRKKIGGLGICRTDIGLLYDPARDEEVDLCLDWMYEMYDRLGMLRVRRNYPYRGTRDSITRAMRDELKGQAYMGVEIIVNRAWAGRSVAIREEVIDKMAATLRTVLRRPQSDAA